VTPNEYQENCLKTMGTFGSEEEQLNFGASLAAGEAGELLNIANKVYWQHHPLDDAKRLHVLEEAGDALWSANVALNAAGWTMEDAMLFNAVKLGIRYAGRFSAEASMARVDTKDLPGILTLVRAIQAEEAAKRRPRRTRVRRERVELGIAVG